ncbi:MAG: flavin reductase family protein [Alphaproteobacteria bacterium]|nr:flavin reductase family protein [Alphaproteobacteria bacterium]
MNLSAFEPTLFRTAMGSFPTGVAVATCRDAAGQPVGITINSLTSVSLNPPLVLFCLTTRARVYPAFAAASSFALNILASGQESESRHFSGLHSDDWKSIVLHDSATDAQPPILAGCIAWLVCQKAEQHPGGDHAIFIGEVTQLATQPQAAPLLYFRKQYRHL